jgi:hypothetical protein
MTSADKKTSFYLLTKREGFDAGGRMRSARQCALMLLDAGIWPLWMGTRNRRIVSTGDQVAIYLAGAGGSEVIATAEIAEIQPWDRKIAAQYPLLLDGTPVTVLKLRAAHILSPSVQVRRCLSTLSFIKPGATKWGVAFMGGCRALHAADFAILTTPEQ